MATLQEITDQFRTAAASSGPLGKTLKFDIAGEGVVHIDGTDVTNEDKPADLTITADKSTLEDMASGKSNPMTAVMTGKLKLSDMGLAMQLQPKLQAMFASLA